MAKREIEVTAKDIIRCGVGAKLYDSFEVLHVAECIRLGKKLFALNGMRKMIVSRDELIRLVRMVNDLPEEFDSIEIEIR